MMSRKLSPPVRELRRDSLILLELSKWLLRFYVTQDVVSMVVVDQKQNK